MADKRQIVVTIGDEKVIDQAVADQRFVVVMWSADGTGKAHIATPDMAHRRTLCGVQPGVGNRVWANTTADMCQRCMMAARSRVTPPQP